MDNRSRFLHNQAATRANEVRERRATVENPQWAMSRPAEWYQNRENLASVKDTLANLKGNRDFWTTDRDESRNMYQMVMNNMLGDRGARMLDLRGLPAKVQADPNRYRYGRTLFRDPDKSQGFFGDVGSLFTGKNKAAVRAKEYNPFHEAGYGRAWYIDEFGYPWWEGFEGAMKFVPGIGMASRVIGGDEREPLTPDRSWIPEGLGSYKKVPMIDLEAMNRDIDEGVGITSLVDSDPEERINYVSDTFGMAPEDFFFPFEGKEDYIRRQNEYSPAPLGSPSPHDDIPIVYPQDTPINTDMSKNKAYQDLNQAEIDFIFGRTDEIADEDMNIPPPIVPFNDTGRETAIASMYGQGPQWGGTNRRYEDEFRDYTERMGDMPGGPMTYEEFARGYERIHQGKPHAGLR